MKYRDNTIKGWRKNVVIAVGGLAAIVGGVGLSGCSLDYSHTRELTDEEAAKIKYEAKMKGETIDNGIDLLALLLYGKNYDSVTKEEDVKKDKYKE